MCESADDLVISIEEVLDFGIVTVKANFSDTRICSLLEKTVGAKLPKTGKILIGKKISIAWMSPDEFAILVKYDDGDKISKKIAGKMKNFHHLCVNVSDSRQCFKMVGKGWREVLSKGAPIDLNPEVFGAGSFRRTRIANMAVSIWTTNPREAYIFCQRSVGNFLFNWLRNSNLKVDQLDFY